jgi:hypothetical protein
MGKIMHITVLVFVTSKFYSAELTIFNVAREKNGKVRNIWQSYPM